jgi:hypothetical protein
LQIERFNLGSKGHLWVLVRSKFGMESGENQLHKSSLESQCKSPVSTDHRNWIVVPTDPTKSVTTLDWLSIWAYHYNTQQWNSEGRR